MEEATFTDAHGVEVLSRWWPVEEPRGLVLISHGASEHSGRYDRWARALNASGVAAAALDHRGHGRTAASSGTGVMGPGGAMAVIDDLHELRGAATARWPGVPVVVFGHSLGSLIALAYLVHHHRGLAGGVLCGFPSDVTELAGFGELLHGMAEAGLRDQPAEGLFDEYNKPFEPARTPFDWLSRDEAEVDAYLADPMCGPGNPLTWGYLIDLFDVVAPAAAQVGEMSCPVLVIAGDHDPAAGMGANATKVADVLRASGVPTDLIIYEGARHELLNEVDRDVVTADLGAWLAGRLAAIG